MAVFLGLVLALIAAVATARPFGPPGSHPFGGPPWHASGNWTGNHGNWGAGRNQWLAAHAGHPFHPFFQQSYSSSESSEEVVSSDQPQPLPEPSPPFVSQGENPSDDTQQSSDLPSNFPWPLSMPFSMPSSFFAENTSDVSEPFAFDQAELPTDVVSQDSMPSSSNFESDNGVLSRSGVDEDTPVGHRHQNRLAIRIPTRLPESTESTPAAALGSQGFPVQLHAIQLPARSAATPAPETPEAEPLNSAPLTAEQGPLSPLHAIQLPARSAAMPALSPAVPFALLSSVQDSPGPLQVIQLPGRGRVTSQTLPPGTDL